MTSTRTIDTSGEAIAQRVGQTWYIRPYKPGDESGLVQLFELVFQRPRSVENLRWKLLARNVGPGELVWLAVEKGSERVIGHYAGISLEIKVEGRVVQGIHSVEAMAHPDYRRKGILTALGTSAHQEWARNGYDLVIGLPNDKWGTRNEALGYKKQFPLIWLKFPLRPDHVLAQHITSRSASSIISAPARVASGLWRKIYQSRRAPSEAVEVVPVDLSEATSDVHSIWTRLGSLYRNIVVRSPSWLRWRYGEEPFGAFKGLMSEIGSAPTGFIVYRVVASKERVTGYIADLFVSPEDSLSARSPDASA